MERRAPWPEGCEAVCFDLDGVLVDSRAPVAACINHALGRLGLPGRPEHELHRLVGPPLRASLAALLAEAGSDPGLADRALGHYREAYASVSLEATAVVAGVPELLGALEGRRRLAVVTSKPMAFAEPILGRLGLRRRFAGVFGPGLADVAEAKAAGLARALGSFGVPEHPEPPGRAVMVGDRSFDVEAGRACGVATVGVAWGVGGADELAGADRFVGTPAELAALLLGR